mmetsp:Transcript_38631/g.88991  ORF Transcript_38631/g.88991 Transcript_38631/m.88991 type:complete len:268 (+) Transcript_38631:52-855(+)
MAALSTTAATEPPAATGKKFLIGGNWKCNGTMASTEALVGILNTAEVPDFCEVVVAPIALHIPYVAANLTSNVAVSAQNVGVNAKMGAFTGELAASQLVDFGLTWCITGHSERREMFGETDELVASKTKVAVDAGLSVMACVGEKLEARKDGSLWDVITAQLVALGAALSEEDWAKVAIAYEPVWAIGTGEVATPAQAQEVHAFIRAWLSTNVSPAVAAATRIQYGGSVKGSNAAELGGCPDVDGFLVGGASLKDDFLNIINAAVAC